MAPRKEVTKAQLLDIIDELQRMPGDRVRILGDAGITAFGLGIGAAAGGGVAALAGATAIPVVTTAASWIGITAVAATPVGWVAGAAVAGALGAYGISRLVRSGSHAEGRKHELLQVYRDKLSALSRREQVDTVRVPERTLFIAYLRDLVETDVIGATQAFRLIEAVEHGAMSVTEANGLIKDLPGVPAAAIATGSGTEDRVASSHESVAGSRRPL